MAKHTITTREGAWEEWETMAAREGVRLGGRAPSVSRLIDLAMAMWERTDGFTAPVTGGGGAAKREAEARSTGESDRPAPPPVAYLEVQAENASRLLAALPDVPVSRLRLALRESVDAAPHVPARVPFSKERQTGKRK